MKRALRRVWAVIRLVFRVFQAFAVTVAMLFAIVHGILGEDYARGCFWLLFAILMFLFDESESIRAAGRRRGVTIVRNVRPGDYR